MAHERKKVDIGLGYELSRPVPRGLSLPGRRHVQKAPQLPKTAPHAGDQVFKYKSQALPSGAGGHFTFIP